MISLIATVFNEGENIHQLFDSIISQTVQPDEIVIVDAGSTDDTLTIMRSYCDLLPLRLLVEPGCNISQGRNRALSAAKGDIIAVSDAGVRLSENWLEKICAPLQGNSDLNVVSGFFQADPKTNFEVALGAANLPLRHEIDPATFLPSSRSIAFRKSAAEAIGGYPEWLDYCEDLVFDLRLKTRCGEFAFQPDALAYFRPRQSLAAFYKQYFLYARGDGKADLWRRRHLIRYLTYLVLVPVICLLGLLLDPGLWILYLICAAVYLYQSYRRLPTIMRRFGRASPTTWIYCILMIPLVRVVGDVAKMLGYPQGWRWRRRHRPLEWRL